MRFLRSAVFLLPIIAMSTCMPVADPIRPHITPSFHYGDFHSASREVACGSTTRLQEGEVFYFRSRESSNRHGRSPYWQPPTRGHPHPPLHHPYSNPYAYFPRTRPYQHIKPRICAWKFQADSSCQLVAIFEHYEGGDLNCNRQYLLLADEERELQICGYSPFPGFFKSFGKTLFIKHLRKPQTWTAEFEGYVTCLKSKHASEVIEYGPASIEVTSGGSYKEVKPISVHPTLDGGFKEDEDSTSAKVVPQEDDFPTEEELIGGEIDDFPTECSVDENEISTTEPPSGVKFVNEEVDESPSKLPEEEKDLGYLLAPTESYVQYQDTEEGSGSSTQEDTQETYSPEDSESASSSAAEEDTYTTAEVEYSDTPERGYGYPVDPEDTRSTFSSEDGDYNSDAPDASSDAWEYQDGSTTPIPASSNPVYESTPSLIYEPTPVSEPPTDPSSNYTAVAPSEAENYPETKDASTQTGDGTKTYKDAGTQTGDSSFPPENPVKNTVEPYSTKDSENYLATAEVPSSGGPVYESASTVAAYEDLRTTYEHQPTQSPATPGDYYQPSSGTTSDNAAPVS